MGGSYTKVMVIDSITGMQREARASDVVTDGAGKPLQSGATFETKYLLAAITVNSDGYAHMRIDQDAIDQLIAIGPLDPLTATIGQICARLILLRSLELEHVIGVGSPSVDGEHFAADTVSEGVINTLINPTNLPTAITFIGSITLGTGFARAIQDHGSSTGNHFHIDAGFGGNSFVLSVDPPVTVADCAIDTNDFRQSMLDHYANGVPT